MFNEVILQSALSHTHVMLITIFNFVNPSIRSALFTCVVWLVTREIVLAFAIEVMFIVKAILL